MKQIVILQKQKSAQVFKTIVDPFIGKYSMIKVKSRRYQSDDVYWQDAEQKLNKLYVFEEAQTESEIPELHAGETSGASPSRQGTASIFPLLKATPIRYGKIKFPFHILTNATDAKNKGTRIK